MHFRSQLLRLRRLVLLSLAGGLAAWLILEGAASVPSTNGELPASLRDSVVYPKLVSFVPLPEWDPTLCTWIPASTVLAATRAQALSARSPQSFSKLGGTTDADRVPRRVIHDNRATFGAIAADPVRGEVVLQDENLFPLKTPHRQNSAGSIQR